jgi:hypothetical protein
VGSQSSQSYEWKFYCAGQLLAASSGTTSLGIGGTIANLVTVTGQLSSTNASDSITQTFMQVELFR